MNRTFGCYLDRLLKGISLNGYIFPLELQATSYISAAGMQGWKRTILLLFMIVNFSFDCPPYDTEYWTRSAPSLTQNFQYIVILHSLWLWIKIFHKWEYNWPIRSAMIQKQWNMCYDVMMQTLHFALAWWPHVQVLSNMVSSWCCDAHFVPFLHLWYLHPVHFWVWSFLFYCCVAHYLLNELWWVIMNHLPFS